MATNYFYEICGYTGALRVQGRVGANIMAFGLPCFMMIGKECVAGYFCNALK
jgi:hypothetical protein